MRASLALENSGLSESIISSYSGTGSSGISSGTAVYDTESNVVELATTTGPVLSVKKQGIGIE